VVKKVPLDIGKAEAKNLRQKMDPRFNERHNPIERPFSAPDFMPSFSPSSSVGLPSHPWEMPVFCQKA
jgi:hypothetical protein